MKKFLFFIIFVGCIALTVKYKNDIAQTILLNYIYKNEFNYSSSNKYKKDTDYIYIQDTINYKPQNKDEILNIIYTGINNGYSEFSFFCDNEYETCIDDVKEITSNNSFLSNINNFVSPYNSYEKLNIEINNLGKIDISVEKTYTDEMINIIEQKVNEIISNNISTETSNYDKIKIIHDYIIDNTTYDKEKAENLNMKTTYNSHTAYGVLIQNYGICSGYADTMSIFLDKFNIPNYRISSDGHIWNLVKLDETWYHLDLTWDDPVIINGPQIISHDYFLISTSDLLLKDQTQHNFDTSIYMEA